MEQRSLNGQTHRELPKLAAKIEFFRVGNGDMTLVTFESGKTLLIDCHIRKAADDKDDKDTADVAAQLKSRLKKDGSGRPYADAMMLSHPDKDHICGFETHFHVGPPGEYVKESDKIIIREMWSSPLIFRRAHKRDHTLCPDAEAWEKEARRRVKHYRDGGAQQSGDRILILSEDVDGKTDDLTAILVKIDETWNTIDGTADDTFEGLLLAPMKAEDDDEDDLLSKNNSSVIVRFTISADGASDACKFLTGGDAEVAVWEKLWGRVKDRKHVLEYDVLQAPHHCSWHSLSEMSWSEHGEDAEVNEDARNALGQALDGALIIASSKPVTDDDADPPCIRAKREYEEIVDAVDGEFVCVGDDGPEPLAYTIKAGGPDLLKRFAQVAIIGRTPVGHG